MKNDNRYIQEPSNYDKFPVLQVTGNESDCIQGWADICARIQNEMNDAASPLRILVIECYQGLHDEALIEPLTNNLEPDLFIDTRSLFLPESEIRDLKEPFLGDHPVFGYMSDLGIEDFLDSQKSEETRKHIRTVESGLVMIYGPGASLVAPAWDILMYADMARWEIQQRMRRNEVSNLGRENAEDAFSLQYKEAYFIDWRACDKLKRHLMDQWDFVLDSNQPGMPKLISGELLREGLRQAARQPFRVAPFFDPGPWGGQWMKEVCDLDRSAINYAWCFDCVPEENSLLLGFGNRAVEIPSINLVFYQALELLGEDIYARFGAEFPIRFDFLDTMDGGNLSLQVHPLTAYIREHFGMDYTQDESYYMLEAEPDAHVYLGLNEGVNPNEMEQALQEAQSGGTSFDAARYVATWPVKKHDHVLIPAGTIHCSGKNSMVLEISATPYIFTFKLWDWGRLGLDGKPRPISIDHGMANIQWERTEGWVKQELLNQVEPIASGEGWREERTGLHQTEFIETRRHWFTQEVEHDTEGTVHVLNLVEGREIIVESPTQAFKSFIVHYAETFIVPAATGAYTIRPFGESEGKECATLKAYVRG